MRRLVLLALVPSLAAAQEPEPFALQPARMPGSDEPVLRGRFAVYEDRAAQTGRVLHLDVLVLPARSDEPRPDPIVFLAGGPGQAATRTAGGHVDSPLRAERDLVFVDQRGTAGDHLLACELSGSDADLGGYLEDIFQADLIEACREELEQRADLRFYGSHLAMDDLDDVRAALGYETINLWGGSYGTRAALVYMQRHPEHARTAVLDGVAPFEMLNPLSHARAAQDALDGLLDACAGDPGCAAAFPELRAELAAVVARLEEEPAKVEIEHPRTKARVTVRLDRGGFAEAVRTMLYYPGGARGLPLLIHRAAAGDLEPFATLAVQRNRSLRGQIAFGMLLCVVCGEDIDRIDPETIERETRGTLSGDRRVRNQMAACELWPRGEVPEDTARPMTLDTPVLLFSGTLDPVTPPRFGELAARHLRRSLHLVLPGCHGVASLGNPCVRGIVEPFLERASVRGIDAGCVDSLRLFRFELPEPRPPR